MSAESHDKESDRIGASDLERALAEIWATELDLDSIGVEENFFAAGGDSMKGMRLLLVVEESLGLAFPASLLGGISTVREMARQLEGDLASKQLAEEEVLDPVIRRIELVMSAGLIPALADCRTIKAMPPHTDAGDDPPLYWCFNSPDAELSELMKVWSVPTKVFGLYSGDSGDAEVTEAVAGHYCDLIIKRRNGRPFYLGGNCRGGRIAERILFKLKESGISPEGAVIMEHATESVFDFSCPVLFLFGEKSIVKKVDQKPIWKLSKKKDSTIQAAKIKGDHGAFFQPTHIGSFERVVGNFITNPKRSQKRSWFGLKSHLER